MIRFTRDGEHVGIRDGDVISVVRLEGEADEETIEAPGLVDFVLEGGEVWVAAGDPPLLRRFGFDGEPIGEPTPLGRGERLVAAPFGDVPAALWLGAEAAE